MAAAAAIAAVGDLGQGAVTLSDADVALTAPPSVEKSAFDAAVTRLQQALPPVFSLQATLEQAPDETVAGPAEFIATLSDAQVLSLRGAISDDRMRDTVDSLARARFPTVQADLTANPQVPQGWTVRVIAAIEALDTLQTGSAGVTPDLIRVTGTSGDPGAAEAAAAPVSGEAAGSVWLSAGVPSRAASMATVSSLVMFLSLGVDQFGATTTPQGCWPTGIDLTAVFVATSITVTSLELPFVV